MLAFLRDQIVEVRIHLVVGIVHGVAPERLALRRQSAGRPLVLMHRRKMADEIPEQVDDAARIFIAKTTEFAIGAAGIEREDRLEMWRLLLGDCKLLGAEAGDADHPDIAVAPILRRDPLDEIVAIPFARAPALRLADAARRADDVDVAARDKELSITGFQRAGPQRRPSRLRRQRRRHVRPLKVLVVDGEGQQCGKFSASFRAVDIDADLDAVAHRHHDVDVAGDR